MRYNILRDLTMEDLMSKGDHKFLDDGFGFCSICIGRRKEDKK